MLNGQCFRHLSITTPRSKSAEYTTEPDKMKLPAASGRGIENYNKGELHGMHERTEFKIVQLQL
jgi:hypothetical protein